MSPRASWSLLTPSMRKVLALPLLPADEMLVVSVTLCVMPGDRKTRLVKLRSVSGSSSISRVVMLTPMALLLVSTIGTSALTETVSATAATLSMKLSSDCWPIITRTPVRASVAKPESATVSS